MSRQVEGVVVNGQVARVTGRVGVEIELVVEVSEPLQQEIYHVGQGNALELILVVGKLDSLVLLLVLVTWELVS